MGVRDEVESRTAGGARVRPLLAALVFVVSGCLIGVALGLWLAGPVEPRPLATRSLTDVTPFLEQIETLKGERELLARRLSELEQQRRAAEPPPQPPAAAEAAERLAALAEERDLLEEQLSKSVGERDRLLAGLEALQRRLAAEGGEREALERRIEELSRAAKSAEKDAAEALEAEKGRTAEAERLRAQADALRDKSDAERAAVAKALEAAQQALAAAQQEREAAVAALRQAESGVAEARSSREQLEREMQKELERLKVANATLQRSLEEVAARARAAEIAAEVARAAEAPALPVVEPVPPRAEPSPAAAPAGLQAASVQAGVEAYRAGDYAGAFRIWLALAEVGSAKAQFHLGALYFEGRGIERNLPEAYRWLASAEAGGYPEAGPLLQSVAASMTAEELEEARRLLAERRG